jgi:hypothetical protein
MKMSNMLNENNSFKDLFNHFKEEPDPAVWEGLKSELKQKNKKKIVVFWGKIASAFVVFIGLFLFFTYSIFSPESIQPVLKNVSESSKNTNIKQYPSLNADSNKSSAELTNAIGPSNINTIDANKPNSEYLPDLTQIHVIQSPFFEPAAAIEPSDLIVSENDPFLKLIEVNKLKLQTFQKSKTLQYHFYFVPPIKSYTIIEAQLLVAKSNLFQTNPVKNLNCNGTAAGVHLNLIKSYRHLELGIGLNYTQINMNGTHNWTKTSIFQDSFLIKKRYTHEMKYHHFLDTSIEKKSTSYNNNFKYFQIPFSMGYKAKLNKKLNVYCAIIGNVNYMFSGSYNINYLDYQDIDIIKSKNLNIKDKITLGLGYRIGLLYKLNKKYEICISMNSQLQYSGIKNNKNSFLPYYNGLSLGIRKYFQIDATK